MRGFSVRPTPLVDILWPVPFGGCSGPYRFFFYSGDHSEPAHVHVGRDDMIAKFWLTPSRLKFSGGFSRQEIQRLQRLVEENAEALLRSWNEFFAS